MHISQLNRAKALQAGAYLRHRNTNRNQRKNTIEKEAVVDAVKISLSEVE
jgi:hypothetical protein